MKKNIFFAAVAALTLSFTACQKDDVNPIVDNGGTNTEVRVKSASDLIGTNWEYTLNLGIEIADETGLADCLDSATIADMLTLTFGLNFDADYAHLTFPEDVIGLNVVENGDEYTVEEISEMAYTYTYDPSTQTGTLSGGNLDEIVLPFTYDAVNDIITVNMMVAGEGDEDNAVPFQLVFTRAI